jgi:urea carboxylase
MTASKSPHQKLLDLILKLEAEMGDLSESKMPCRRFKLPLTFKSKRQNIAFQRYIATQCPHASYLPDTMGFVAKNNALTERRFHDVSLNSALIVVAVEFFCAPLIGLPIDLRKRMNCPKMNPDRVFTLEG